MGISLIPPPRLPHTFFAENPVTSDEGPVFYTDVAIVLAEMRAVVQGGSSPSVAWTLRYASSRAATGTEIVTGGNTCTNTTTGQSVTSFNSGTISAGSFVWLELGTVSSGANAPDEFTVTLIGNV